MNDVEKERLRKVHKILLDDVRLNDILPLLRQEGVLDDDDEERIRVEKTRKDGVRLLLGMLPHRGRQAYPVFRRALITEYAWIVTKLDNTAGLPTVADECDGACGGGASGGETPKAEPIKEINTKVLMKVSSNPEVLRDWKRLARSLGVEEHDITEVEYAERFSVKEATYQALLRWQCRKGRAANPATLIAGLRESGFAHLADELEGK